MRIIVVQETDWLTRGPHKQHHLFERLSLRGHEIVVLDYEILWRKGDHRGLLARRQEFPSVSKIYPGAEIEVIRPATIRLLPLCRLSSVVTHYFELQRLVTRFQPDVIVSYALSTGYAALWVAKQHKIPYVFDVIDALHTIAPVKFLQGIAKWAEKLLYREADQVLLLNEGLRDYAIKLGAPRAKTIVLRQGVDLERINPQVDGSKIRKRWGLADDDVVLFFMGWLYEFSGVKDVARGLIEVVREQPRLKFLVVGDGDGYAELCRMRDVEELRGRLILTGRQPYEKIPQYLAAADVCLLPFHRNQVTEHVVPIKVYEYMAAGKPVIATELPGVMQDIPTGNGVLYVGTASECVRAIPKLVQDSEEVKKHGEKARVFVEAHCDWEKLVLEFEQVLMRQVQGRR